MSYEPPNATSFLGPVLRDSYRILLPEAAYTAAAATEDVAVADPDNDPFAELRALSGVVFMGPADGLEVMPLGTDANNEDFNLYITRLDPMVSRLSGVDRLVGFVERSLFEGSCNLGNTVLGNPLESIDGIPTNARPASAITVVSDATPADIGSSGETRLYYSRSSSAPIRAVILAPAHGSMILRVKASTNGVANPAATAMAIGRRIRGQAMPAKSGG